MRGVLLARTHVAARLYTHRILSGQRFTDRDDQPPDNLIQLSFLDNERRRNHQMVAQDAIGTAAHHVDDQPPGKGAIKQAAC